MSDLLSFQEASIPSHCQTLRLSTVGAQLPKLAEQATRQGRTHLRYFDALLTAALEGWLITRRLFGAKIPRLKTLDAFDFQVSPVAMPQIRELAEGGYLERAKLVLFLGGNGHRRNPLNDDLVCTKLSGLASLKSMRPGDVSEPAHWLLN